MTDLLAISSGAIVIRNPSGSIRFTTNEAMFHVTETKTGSINITFPFMPSASAFDRVTSYPIDSVNSSATHVFGMLKTSNDAYGRLENTAWYDASATYFHRQHWITEINSEPGNLAISLRHWLHYTFRVSAGTLFLDEVAHFSQYNTGGLQSILPESLTNFSIAYRLKIGLFV